MRRSSMQTKQFFVFGEVQGADESPNDFYQNH